jgi:16S rRNA U1498 N3-methylase RsmE
MRRLILAAAPDADGRFRLEGKDFHYMARVLRLGEGDSFRALLPDGSEIQARVYRTLRDRLEAVVWKDPGPTEDSRRADEQRRAALRKAPSIALLQALPKGRRWT